MAKNNIKDKPENPFEIEEELEYPGDWTGEQRREDERKMQFEKAWKKYKKRKGRRNENGRLF